MEMKEIVMKLIGPIQPTGESGPDLEHLRNMYKLTELVSGLLAEINRASSSAERHENSMRIIGERARDFLAEVTATYHIDNG